MKIKYIVLIGIILLLVLGVLFILVHNKKVKEKIESISSFSFFYTNGYAINSDIRYEIDCKKECIAIIKQYGKDEDEKVEAKIDDETLNKIVEVLNRFDVLKWDRFSKSDKNVLDGDSFSMHFTYNDGKRVSANGYMVWPANYRNVRDELDNIFKEVENDRD